LPVARHPVIAYHGCIGHKVVQAGQAGTEKSHCHQGGRQKKFPIHKT
jgi:hypothetical protein